MALLNQELRVMIDPYIAVIQNTKKLADNLYATYMCRRKVGLISARDFWMVTFVYEHEDGSGKITVL